MALFRCQGCDHLAGGARRTSKNRQPCELKGRRGERHCHVLGVRSRASPAARTSGCSSASPCRAAARRRTPVCTHLLGHARRAPPASERECARALTGSPPGSANGGGGPGTRPRRPLRASLRVDHQPSERDEGGGSGVTAPARGLRAAGSGYWPVSAALRGIYMQGLVFLLLASIPREQGRERGARSSRASRIGTGRRRQFCEWGRRGRRGKP